MKRAILLATCLSVGCGDKAKDGSDSGDGSEPERVEGTEPGDCDDEIDNDADGTVDCDDSGCEQASECQEDSGEPSNSAPELSLALSPAEPGTDDILRVEADASDPEGDELVLSFVWTVDGEEVGADEDSLDGATWFDVGQLVSVTVTASDGEESTSATAGPVTVVNTAPGAPVISILPAAPGKGHDLWCVVDEDPEDPDGDELSYSLSWELGGVAWTGGTDSVILTDDTVLSDDTSTGDTWACTVTPHDGDEAGTPATVEVEVGAFTGWDPSAVTAADADYVFTGAAHSDFTADVTIGGDFDGDGLVDLAFGAQLADTAGVDSGVVYVYFADKLGSPGTSSTADAHLVIPGPQQHDQLGIDLSTCDLDGDGLEDLVLTAEGYTTSFFAGLTWVIYGSTLATASSPFDLDDADVYIEGDSSRDYAYAVDCAGDVDGDGTDDLLIGASGESYEWSSTGSQAIFLGSGLQSGTSYEVGDADQLLYGSAAWEDCGSMSRFVGDVDGDGLDDFVTGCKGGDHDKGRAYLVLAADLWTPAKTLGDVTSLCVDGAASWTWLHQSYGLGDIDGDGLGDWLLSAEEEDTAYVFLAKDLTASSGCVEASTVASTTLSSDRPGDHIGQGTHTADLNGDGHLDLVTAAYDASTPLVYVFMGYDGSAALSAADADYTFEALTNHFPMGVGARALGDVDGDGLDDLLLSSPREPSVSLNSGSVNLFLTP